MDRNKSLLDPGQIEEAVCNFAASRGIRLLLDNFFNTKGLLIVKALHCHATCYVYFGYIIFAT